MGISIGILINYNQTYQAAFAGTANEVTGKIDRQYNNVEYYFHLKEANKSLVAQNSQLLNLLGTSFDAPDSAKAYKIDSLLRDTLGRTRRFTYLPAKVVNNSVSEEYNYITLYRGKNQGVKNDMAVIGPDGVVGRVVLVSNNYCTVMSLLNRNSKVNAMMKKDFSGGTVEWDGSDPNYLTLRGITKGSLVKKGDTVITSNIERLSLPPGIIIGTVTEVKDEPGGSKYLLTVKPATNFFNLQYAYLVEDVAWGEQKEIEAATKKLMEAITPSKNQ